jgi:hypothetical protein
MITLGADDDVPIFAAAAWMAEPSAAMTAKDRRRGRKETDQ